MSKLFPIKKEDALSRKNLMIVTLAALFALFFMLISYIHWLPMRNVQFSISWAGVGDERFAPNNDEVRILYILVDDEMIVLDSYAQDGWQYEGSLVTRQGGTVSFDFNARRYVEVSLQRGHRCGIASVVQDGEVREYNLSHRSDNMQEIIITSTNSFLSARNIALGLFTFIATYVLSYILLGKCFSNHLNKLPTMADVIICVCIPIATVLSMIMSEIYPLSHVWLTRLDISGFTAGAKLYSMGRVPYKEIWEHKGPLIFFVNTIGHKLWYPYGVWFLELFLQIAGFFMCNAMLKLRFSRLVSFFATIMAIGTYGMLQDGGGNVSSWSLPFIFSAGYVFIYTFKNGFTVHYKQIILCGAFCAIVFLFRANGPILWSAAIPVLIVNQIYQKRLSLLFRQMGWFCIGFAAIAVPVCLYFYVNNALWDMIDATILFNMTYSEMNNIRIISQVNSSINLFERLLEGFPHFAHIVMIGFAYPAIHLLYLQQKKQMNGNFIFDYNILVFQIIGFISFIMFGTMSARPYPNYMIVAIPTFAIAFAYTLTFLYDMLFRMLYKSKTRFIRTYVCITLLSIYLVLPMFTITIAKSMSDRKSFSEKDIKYLAVANYIMANTHKNDTYGFWGSNHTIINMTRDRLPSTRFFYTLTSSNMHFAHQRSFDNYLVYMQEIEDAKPNFFVVSDQALYYEIEQFIKTYYSPVYLFQYKPDVELFVRNSE